MRVDALHFDLPPERIAQHPPEERDAGRLMVLGEDGISHRQVTDLPELLPAGALLVVNDTRVLPARLVGEKPTGGKVEIFLLRRVEDRDIQVEGRPRRVEVWRALGRSSKALRFDTDLQVGPLTARLLGRDAEGILEVGLSVARGTVVEAVRAVGHVPLPPYIKRDDEQSDIERYQTVFSRVEGAVAAPTAGLHMSRALLGQLALRGIELASVTLHVGLGTFQPVKVDDLDDHPMHAEWYEVSAHAAAAVTRARQRGAPVVAVGTTVVRALESAAAATGEMAATSGETRLLIQPGYTFRAVDMLFTNFHLPRSTLLAMVCAFGGTERVLDAYATAVREAYRFYSYGDAMLVTRHTT